MSLSHLLKSANRRLGLSILQNHGRISSSASYRASQVPNRKIDIIENKGSSSSWLRSLLFGRPYNQQQSCSDDALYQNMGNEYILKLRYINYTTKLIIKAARPNLMETILTKVLLAFQAEYLFNIEDAKFYAEYLFNTPLSLE
ncbi:hypothetical protein A2U01_0006420 [Trifolium medium]|uniref:Uncharacterized protein n=1 Tax=Trifolium medium TaxID=97028 RepID=A0A392MDJ1_9FABA|nr:hypothetical protein [Trifolium medium]